MPFSCQQDGCHFTYERRFKFCPACGARQLQTTGQFVASAQNEQKKRVTSARDLKSPGALFFGTLIAGLVVVVPITLVVTSQDSLRQSSPSNSAQSSKAYSGAERDSLSLESCEALADLAVFLRGDDGPGDDSTLNAWTIALKNRFDQDPETDLTEDLNDFRISLTETFQDIRSYGSSEANDLISYVAMARLKSDIEGHLSELGSELGVLMSRCNLPPLEPGFQGSEIVLADFWETGFWAGGSDKNSLGERTLFYDQSYFDEESNLTVTAAIFCAPIEEAKAQNMAVPFMVLSAWEGEYRLRIEGIYGGDFRARIDDGELIRWKVDDMQNGRAYKLWDDQMSLLAKSHSLALQMKVDGSAFDFTIGTRGLDVVFDKFRAHGCEF